MANSQSLPEELLLSIFSNLQGRDLITCQYVCHSWYILARVQFLTRVSFPNSTKVNRFIASFDCNPNTRFLAAVKTIDVLDETNSWKPTVPDIRKLLFRFHNLKSVTLNRALTVKFSDDLCREFLRHCPKLQDVKVGGVNLMENKQLLNKVRLLITDLNFSLDLVDQPEQFAAKCPRLKILHSTSRFNSFLKMLPMLENMPGLRTIRVEQFTNDPDDFMTGYLQTKTQEQQNQLLERLSRITELDLDCAANLSEGSQQFILKYMTGLTTVTIESAFPENIEQFQLYPITIRLLHSIKHCTYETRIPNNIIWDCVPSFIQKAINRPPTRKKFQLFVHDNVAPKLQVLTKTDGTVVSMLLSHRDLYKQHNLFGGDLLEMDTFVVDAPKYYNKIGHMSTYDALFHTQTTLKQVIFKAPERLIGGEGPIDVDVGRNHTSVEKLMILSKPNAEIESLLERCYFAFVNLRELTLHGFCGTWLSTKYQLELERYKLDKLMIHLRQEDKKFTVVDVSVGRENRCMYKIPFNGSETATRIEHEDLEDLVRGKDYVLIHLVVGSVRCLKIAAQVNKKFYTKLDVEYSA